jgi:uncharacterized protein
VPSVIVDTSCIQYLYQINLLSLLPAIYDQIIIPNAVATELEQGRIIGISLPNLSTLEWISVSSVPSSQLIPTIPNLGMGEREVLSLALTIPNSLAILDDNLARTYAKQLKASFTGTLGILLKAKQLGHIIAISPLLNQLDALGFRLDVMTKQTVLKLAGESINSLSSDTDKSALH